MGKPGLGPSHKDATACYPLQEDTAYTVPAPQGGCILGASPSLPPPRSSRVNGKRRFPIIPAGEEWAKLSPEWPVRPSGALKDSQ
jgi:hypothetical protein